MLLQQKKNRFIGATIIMLLTWPSITGQSQSLTEPNQSPADTSREATQQPLAPDSSATDPITDQHTPEFDAENTSQDYGPETGRECMVTNVFYDTDLREVLYSIAAQCGLTIVSDESVLGIVTVELVDITVEEALRRILIPYGMTYRWMGDYYLVGAAHPDNPSFPLLSETELYRPNFIKAIDVPKLLSRYYEPFLGVNDRTNTVSLTGSPDLIARMKADLAEIDRPPRQVMIKALVTEASSDVNRELGITWGVEGSKKDGNRNFRVETYPPTNVAADSTFGAFFERLGIKSKEWTYAYHVRLNALVEEGKARIRANPRIATLEGQQARIFVGREEYFSILTGSVAYAYERLEVIKTGISLSITPYVSDDGLITLEVNPEVSDVIGSGSTGLPVTSMRSVSTKVRVRDGETVVIGGLLVKNRMEVVRKVPLLGSIPILGLLFRHTSTRVEESEITILITPHLLE